jgi:RNA polymerase sigma-70 factor (ECF subfamily)
MDHSHGNPLEFDAASCIAGILRGDRAAENSLASFFQRRIFTYALRTLREPALAEDAVQETLWAAVKSLREGKLAEPDQLFAFVYGIARNRVADMVRRAARNRHDAFPPGFEPPAPADLSALDRERRDLAADAIRELDPSDRAILNLVLVDGLTLAEIAGRLALKPDAVRQRKSRALKRVIEKLRSAAARGPRLMQSVREE